MRKNRILLFVLTVCMLLLISGCNKDETEKIGVVDKKRIFQESVFASEIKAMDEQIAKLEEGLAAKKGEVQKQLVEKERQANVDMQQTWQKRAQEKEQELNNAIVAKHKDFLEQKEQEFRNFVTTIEQDVNSQLDTLVAKLVNNPNLSDEERKQIEKEIEDTKKQAESKIKEKNNLIQSEVNAKLADDRVAMNSTMETFAQNLREELFEKHKKELDAFAESLLGDDQKAQNELKNKQTELMKKADTSIKDAIKQVSQEKKLDVVFIEYQANIAAIDITEDVLKKLKDDNANADSSKNKEEEKKS